MKKSDNLKGNPYHDEEGKFTSENGGGTNTGKLESGLINKVQLKQGVDVETLKARLNFLKDPLNSELLDVETVAQANEQGNKILGYKAVSYDESTSPKVAKEFNKALQAAVRDFPELFKNNMLFCYGTSTQMANFGIVSSTFDKITSNPLFRERLSRIFERDFGKQIGGEGEEEIIKKIKSKIFYRADVLQDGLKNQVYDGGENDIGGACGTSGFDILDTPTRFVKSEFLSLPLVSSIAFNKSYYVNEKTAEDFSQSGSSNGFFKKIKHESGTFGTGIHELGHHIFTFLYVFSNNEEKKKLSEMYDQNIYNKFDDYDTQRYVNEGIIATSGYSKRNEQEHAAEAIEDVYCNKQDSSHHNQKTVQILKDIYNRIYGNK